MFKAIGTVIVLYALSNIMHPTFESFQNAAVATFGTIETAANVSSQQLETQLQSQ